MRQVSQHAPLDGLLEHGDLGELGSYCIGQGRRPQVWALDRGIRHMPHVTWVVSSSVSVSFQIHTSNVTMTHGNERKQ